MRAWIALAGLAGVATAALGAVAPTALAAGRAGSSSGVAARAMPMGLVIRTARIQLHMGTAMRTVTVLTTASGRTLYYFRADTDMGDHLHIACSGACAKIWPPLATKDPTVDAPRGVPGHFTITRDRNGRQVLYQAHPLYTYTGDMGPRQARGEGKFGKWFVATPSLSMNAM